MKTVLGLALCGLLASALAADATPPTKPRAGSVRFIPSPSQESSAERERRLRRECRGRPDAGACLGHTR